jgi:hypothetical protein
MHRIVRLPYAERLIVPFVLIVAALPGAALYVATHVAPTNERVYGVVELERALAQNPAVWRGRTVLVRGNASFGPIPICPASQSCVDRYVFLWPAAPRAGLAISYAQTASGAWAQPIPSATAPTRQGHPGPVPGGTAGSAPPAPPILQPAGGPVPPLQAIGGPFVFSIGHTNPILAFARRLPGIGALLHGPQHIAWFAPATYRVRLADALSAACSPSSCAAGTLVDAAESVEARTIPVMSMARAQRSAAWTVGPPPTPAAP